ncbi:hypothetical protein ABW21_db0204818 [Orbilia brochopaga]|nr:hypothetical protein ABW21_db0204818 [Drechslerella brochopaga]
MAVSLHCNVTPVAMGLWYVLHTIQSPELMFAVKRYGSKKLTIRNHQLAYYIVASYLITILDETSQVAYIDTTGAFSPVTLLQVLMHRLQQDATHVGEARPTSIRDTAAQMLDRVQYMRAFDFDGVVEAVEEVAVGIQTEMINPEDPGVDEKDEIAAEEEADGVVLPAATGNVETSSEAEVQSNVVPDSLADSDEEIFWPLPPILRDDTGIRKKKRKEKSMSEKDDERRSQQSSPSEIDKAATPSAARHEETKTVGLLIIDSISRPMEQLMDTNEVAAHVSLTQLSTKLRSLARDRDMAILLLSSPVFQQSKAKDRKDLFFRNLSAFASIEPTDGLVHTLNKSVDMNVMVSRYPHKAAHKRRRGGQEAFVVEVINQRYSDGKGQWGSFAIKDGTQLVDIWPAEKEPK